MDSDKILESLDSCTGETCEGCGFDGENNCMARLMSMAKVEIVRLRNENERVNADLRDAVGRLFELTDKMSEYMAAVDAYLEDEERERMRWIPVAERLPDHDAVVLAYFPEMEGSEGRIQTQKGWSVTKYCTHWMPLPDSPRTDSPEKSEV